MHEDDPKAENLMIEIWHGKEAIKCDGNIFGYSNLTYILYDKGDSQIAKNNKFFETITRKYEPNY